MKFTILFNCVGKRVELLQRFRLAAKKKNIDLVIIGTDLEFTAPALHFCDKKYFLPLVKDSSYIPRLFDICQENSVDLVIPTIDKDLLLLAENQKMFYEIGTKILISDIDKVRICRDKNYTGEYFSNLGLNSPLTYNNVVELKKHLQNKDIAFPLFIKPKDGSSSINAYIVNDMQDLDKYINIVDDYIVQNYIKGKEYTVDVLCDFDGNLIYITPRERLEVMNGEVVRTKMVLDQTIIEETKKIIADFKPCGPITIQCIKDEKSHKNYYIEINPRFGGGAPLSMKAGANSAEALLDLLCGSKVGYDKNAAKDGAIYTRFMQSVLIKEEELQW